jgi:GTP cyclohydrolase I
MKDIQSQQDHRRINIKKVGVKDISYPITVLDKANKLQRTVSRVNMYVNLPHRFKGTHMSRFVEILNRFHGAMNLASFHRILEEMKVRLEAQAAHVELEFPYFVKKKTSRVNTITVAEYDCKMHGSLEDEDDLTLEIRIPVFLPGTGGSSMGMPRSPGRWGSVLIAVRFGTFIWMEELIQNGEAVIADYCRAAASSESGELVLSVEELAKALGEKIKENSDISWFSVTVENLADGYSTFASLEWPE